MLHESTSLQLSLESGEAVSLVRAENCDLQCLDGTIWITEENGGQDVVLEAGQHYRLAHQGRTVVQSLAPNGAAHCRLELATHRNALMALIARWMPELGIGKPSLRLVFPRLEIL